MNSFQKQFTKQLPLMFGFFLVALGAFFLYRNYVIQQQYIELSNRELSPYLLQRLLQRSPDQLLPIFVIGIGVALSAFGLFQYLQGSRAKSDEYFNFINSRVVESSLKQLIEASENVLARINLSINNFENRIANTASPKVDFTNEEKKQILTALTQSVTGNLTNGFMKAVDEAYSKQIVKSKQWDKLLSDLNVIRERLLREVGDLSRRANVNLVIGVGTTILAVIGLLYVVFGNSIDLSNTPKDERVSKILFYYIPRLSLIVFIEVFAYFFLRLYKTGLSDIKFYQNELTNVEIKMAALESSFMFEDKDILTLVISELSKTERNFILKRDETTVELEKLKVDGVNAKDWLEHITSLLKAKSS